MSSKTICSTRNPWPVSDQKSDAETWANVAADKWKRGKISVEGLPDSRLCDQLCRGESPGEEARGRSFGETSLLYRSYQ
jgi:hypothetical protein